MWKPNTPNSQRQYLPRGLHYLILFLCMCLVLTKPLFWYTPFILNCSSLWFLFYKITYSFCAKNHKIVACKSWYRIFNILHRIILESEPSVLCMIPDIYDKLPPQTLNLFPQVFLFFYFLALSHRRSACNDFSLRFLQEHFSGGVFYVHKNVSLVADIDHAAFVLIVISLCLLLAVSVSLYLKDSPRFH